MFVSIAFLHVNLDFPNYLRGNFVVDGSKAFCNFTFEIMKFKADEY